MAKSIKLKWHKIILHGFSDAGVDEAEAWESKYKDYYIIVYPLELIREGDFGCGWKIYIQGKEYNPRDYDNRALYCKDAMSFARKDIENNMNGL
jgi:hypothetical protein